MGWEKIALAITRVLPHSHCNRKQPEVVVVGASEVALLCNWPSSLRVAADLDGARLLDIVTNARVCIGGATGLSHLAGALRRPALSLWKTDDRAVFAPRPGWTLVTQTVARIDESVTHSCADFVQRALAKTHPRSRRKQ